MRKLLLLLLLVLLLSSCAVVDYSKRVAGYSITNFEDEQDGKFSFTSTLELKQAYNKCNLFLFENKLQINFQNDKKMYIVASKFSLIYKYTLDSTEVAFFISEADDKKTKVEVVSNNAHLAKFVYTKLSEYFKK